MDGNANIWSKALLVPEILEAILKTLDTERLKRCRGVCLAWCNEISRIFQRRVIPRKFDPDWSEFLELLNRGKGLPRLLTPFQEMHVKIGQEEYNPRSFDWLHPLLPVITSLSIAVPYKFGEIIQANPALSRHILKIIQHCSKTLKSLTTPFWSLTEESPLESQFQLPQLRKLTTYGFELNYCIHSQPHEPKIMETELRFFLLLVSAAPKLSSLSLELVSCAPELLRRASLKKLEELIVVHSDGQAVWRALSQIDTEGLKSLLVIVARDLDGREHERFFTRFSGTLEQLEVAFKSSAIPTECPRVKAMDICMENSIAFALFPSLQRVLLVGKGLNPNTEPCLTVSHVSIDKVPTAEASSPKTVLKQLLRLFPFATSWEINYRALQDFCQVVADSQRPIEKLEVKLNCISGLHPCVNARSSVEEAAETDLRTFSNLHLLTNLRELVLNQDLKCWPERSQGEDPGEQRLLPFTMAGVPLSNLLQLRTLRIHAESHELPPDFLSLHQLHIAVELVIVSSPRSPDWSDSIVAMRNLTISH